MSLEFPRTHMKGSRRKLAMNISGIYKSEGNIKSEGKVRPIHTSANPNRGKSTKGLHGRTIRARETLRTCAANVYCHTSIDLSLEPDGETIVNIPRQRDPRKFEQFS